MRQGKYMMLGLALGSSIPIPGHPVNEVMVCFCVFFALFHVAMEDYFRG